MKRPSSAVIAEVLSLTRDLEIRELTGWGDEGDRYVATVKILLTWDDLQTLLAVRRKQAEERQAEFERRRDKAMKSGDSECPF